MWLCSVRLRLKVFSWHLLTEPDNWKFKTPLKFLNYPRGARLEECPGIVPCMKIFLAKKVFEV
jgi:hypothetical protein